MTIKTVSSSQISGIDSLESGDDVWVRPSDWLQLPLVGDTEQKFVGLLAVNTVTSNWGTASDNPAIATAKGWTVTG